VGDQDDQPTDGEQEQAAAGVRQDRRGKALARVTEKKPSRQPLTSMNVGDATIDSPIAQSAASRAAQVGLGEVERQTNSIAAPRDASIAATDSPWSRRSRPCSFADLRGGPAGFDQLSLRPHLPAPANRVAVGLAGRARRAAEADRGTRRSRRR